MALSKVHPSAKIISSDIRMMRSMKRLPVLKWKSRPNRRLQAVAKTSTEKTSALEPKGAMVRRIGPSKVPLMM